MRLLSLILSFACLLAPHAFGADRKTEHVFLITVDGLRWQELFSGAEEQLIHPETGGVKDTNFIGREFWRPTPEARREALLPFFWKTIAQQGQIFGNKLKGSKAYLTNGRKFTYPGFNEILTGFADDRINKNEKRNNPNVTVLEWLHQKPAFTNRVIAFPNWDVFPYILNTERSRIPAWTGFDRPFAAPPGSRLELIQQMFNDITPFWQGFAMDVFFLHAAKEVIPQRKPRVMWIAFGETDEWAHEGRYDNYLWAARKMDDYVRQLWELAQSLPEYKGKTSFLLTCDHGRGTGPVEWRNHGAAVEGAEEIWIAALGPDTRPLGERTNCEAVTQSQVAATLAALLGEDYKAAVPKAGAPIRDVVGGLKE